MKRGPAPGANRQHSSVTKAHASWGDEVPAWLAVMASACDETSQNQVARTLGVSAAQVSNVLGKRYGVDGHPGDLKAIEAAVRAHFMAERVDCPELGNIPGAECQDWQVKSKTFANVNRQRVVMYGACRKCPLSRTGGSNA